MEAIESAELGQQVYREHTWSREREGLVGHVSSLLGSENASAS